MVKSEVQQTRSLLLFKHEKNLKINLYDVELQTGVKSQ